MPRGPHPLRPVAQALLGLALGLLACEALLRAGAWVLGATTARDAGAPEADAWIVCHGDSNVYGLYESPDDAYPGQLQQRLEPTNPGVRVRNDGVPGLSTRHLIESLDGLPSATRALVVTAGVNNAWSWHAEDAFQRPPWHERLRLVRLVRVLARPGAPSPESDPTLDDRAMFAAAEGEDTRAEMRNRDGERVRFRGRAESLGVDAWAASIHGDLETLARRTAERGIALVVVTYATDEGPYGIANQALRAAAAELGIPLVDVAPQVERLAGRLGHAAVYHRDLHPRPAGYAVAARLVFRRLVELGVVAGEPLADPLAGIEAPDDEAPEARLERSGDGALTLHLAGLPPSARIAVVFFGLRPVGERFPWRSFPALESEDEIFRLTSRDPRLTVWSGTDGTARVPLGSAFASSAERGALDIEVCLSELNRNGLLAHTFPATTLTIP